MENVKKEIVNSLKINGFRYSTLSFLAGDASDRKYFEINQNKNKYVLMYDQDKKNLKKFISITKTLRDHLSVPNILWNFEKNNILILENFGKTKYGLILNKTNRQKLHNLAIETIINLQKIKTKKIPIYSKKMFIEESNLFFDWYLNTEKITKNSFKKEFNYVFLPLLEKFADLPQVLVHRDYHIDNLFYLAKRKNFLRCGLIDYQDAVIGPCVYDLVSLTQDARIDIPKQLESHLIKYYLKKNTFIDKELFRYCYNIIAIQRHLKVLGIFSRLSIRDNKKQYLNHLPRVKNLLFINLQQNNFKKLSSILLPLIKND